MSHLWRVQLSLTATDDLSDLDKPIRQAVIDRLEWLAINFETIKHEQLTGKLKDYYKLRASDYRAVYLFHYSTKTITVIRIGRRDKIYKLTL